jgi:hypothetical protein
MGQAQMPQHPQQPPTPAAQAKLTNVANAHHNAVPLGRQQEKDKQDALSGNDGDHFSAMLVRASLNSAVRFSSLRCLL